jgi:hypothetical protein
MMKLTTLANARFLLRSKRRFTTGFLPTSSMIRKSGMKTTASSKQCWMKVLVNQS